MRIAFACVIIATATAAIAAEETAKSADAFVDSIGVNTHYGNAANGIGNAYFNPLLDAKLAELGIRHLRDHTWSDAGLARIDGLYTTYGIRTNLILGETTRSPAQLVNLLKNHPAYEAIEGLNEPDFTTRSYNGLTDNPSANDYSATRAFQNDLYAAFKADPQTSHTPVLSPAMGRSFRSHHLIPIGFDVAAMHHYAWVTTGITSHPPSAGLDTAIADMAALRGSKPLWATESGYFNRSSTDTRRVPESVSAKYIPRLFGEFFNRGIERTYLYELADQGPSTTAREENFGLLRYDMSEKPAFVAMENLIDLLEDPEAGEFTTDALDYTLTGSGDISKVHHTLLQKSDGRFYLMLWQEAGGFDRSQQTVIVNPPIAVTLTLNDPMAQASTYLTNQSLTPTATYLNPTLINLNVPDEMLVVELTPIPEPTGAALLLVVGAASARRRRQRA
jgi:hypothetical protein